MGICFIPQAIRGKGLPTLRLLSCIRRKTYILFLPPWQRFMHILQNFQLLGKILLFIFHVFVFVFFSFLTPSGQYCGIKPITSVWAFKRKEPGRAVSLELVPWRLGCAGLLLLPAHGAAPSLQLLDPSQCRGHGESPFIPLSPPHCALALDTRSPKWVFS